MREQSTAGAQAAKDIADAKDSIGDLHAKIIEIKKKAEASEQMVQEICRDIKQLDVAKRHLTHTINTLARLRTLSESVGRLKEQAARREYQDAADSLTAAIQMFTYFTEYSRVPKVSELAGIVERIRGELREAVNEDFDVLIDCVCPADMSFEQGGAAAAPMVLTADDLRNGDGLAGSGGGDDDSRALTEDRIATLQSACEVIDALGPAVRKSMLKAFNRKQLKPYTVIFRKGSDLGDRLENIEKRYAWFRRGLRDLEDKYGRVLPKRWRVHHRLCLEFAETTRADIDRILGQYDPPSSAPAEALLKALLKTIAFEKEMSKKFESDLRRDGGGSGDGSAEFAQAPLEAEDEEDEKWDDSAPLYNDKGELVDPTTAEGIRLKYKRKKEWEERKKKEYERKAVRAERRAWIASLAGDDTGAGGGARGGAGGAGAGAGSSGSGGASASQVVTGRASLEEEIAALPKIAAPGEGIISAAFKPYMASYVKFERSNIDSIVAQTMAEADGGKADSGAGPAAASILPSASALFGQARNAIARCVQLSTGQTLFELYKEIREALSTYAGALTARMPKPQPSTAASLPGETYTVTEADAHAQADALCLIINTSGECAARCYAKLYCVMPSATAQSLSRTDSLLCVCVSFPFAEFCAETVPKFAESVSKVIDAAFKEHINAESTQEVFFTLTAAALKTLSGLGASLLDGALVKLSKHPWTSLSEVGDQSAYVADMQRALRVLFPIVRKRLDDAPFRNFCDKFVRALIPRYQASIYRCKKVGETGAQQLLLDAQAIKSLLLAAPAMRPASDRVLSAGAAAADDDDEAPVGPDDEPPPPPPAVYVKFVQKEVPRVELLLKIIATPKERFANTIRALWPDASVAELTRVMDLKNMAKKEQQDVLLALGLVKPNAIAMAGMAGITGGLGAAMGGMSMSALTGGGGGGGGGAGAAAASSGAGGAGGPGVAASGAGGAPGSVAAAAAAAAAAAGGAGAGGAGGASLGGLMSNMGAKMGMGKMTSAAADMGKLFGVKTAKK